MSLLSKIKTRSANALPKPAEQPSSTSITEMLKQEMARTKGEIPITAGSAPATIPAKPLPKSQEPEVVAKALGELVVEPGQLPDTSETLQAAMEELRHTLQELSANIDSDQVSTNVHRAMTFLRGHPRLADMLRPEDIGLLVRACAKSAGLVVGKKTANKVARTKRQEESAKLAAEMNIDDLDFG